LEPNAILLTQHDNDSYPAWMLQDAHGLREDVLVLNIDFLLLQVFREKIFADLGLPSFNLDQVDVDEYRKNWKNVVQHFLGNYTNERPLYIGLTVSSDWYQGFDDNLSLHGLAYKFINKEQPTLEMNRALYEEVWDLDSINADFEGYYGGKNVISMNTNYLKSLKVVYDKYLESGDLELADKVYQVASKISTRTNNKEVIEKTDSLFGNHLANLNTSFE
jgi:hypothetical protein